MTLTEVIVEKIRELPEEKAREVIDFIDFLPGPIVERTTRKFLTKDTKVLAISTTFLALTVHLDNEFDA